MGQGVHWRRREMKSAGEEIGSQVEEAGEAEEENKDC